MDSKFFKFLVFVLIIIIALVVSSNSDKQEVTLVKTSDELTKILDIKGLVIIDIRNSDEFKESHIPNAINIPYNELKSRLKYSLKTPILVYSKNDSRSHLAALQLKQMNYVIIYELGNMEIYNGNLIKS